MKAELAFPPPFAEPKRQRNRARADGIRYENKVHLYIQEAFPDLCVLGPWVQFFKKSQPEEVLYCQPDALIIDIRRGTIVIIEIKLKHTSDAWWQIKALYAPVIQHIFGDSFRYISIEVAKWFDSHTRFPERFEFADRPREFTSLSSDKFYVHLWNGRTKLNV